MGEIAEMMLEGTLCAGCGEYLGHDNGYAEYCYSCNQAEQRVAKKRDDEALRVAILASKNALVNVESLFNALFDPGVGEHFRKQLHGLVRGMYVNENGVITHDGMRMTIQNNQQAQKRAEQRKAKQAARATK